MALAELAPKLTEDFDALLKRAAYEEVTNPPVEDEAAEAFLSRDAKDVHVALAAIQAQVDCLVTYDKDLTESEPLHERMKVLLPPVFLRDYMGWSSEQLEAIRNRT